MTKQQQLIPLYAGKRLRQERKKRGLELVEVASYLRIDLPVLQALEQDKLNHLASVYQRAYITAYARYLEFEESEVKQMLGSVGDEHPEIHTVFPEAGKPNQADRWLKATSYVLASLLVGTLAWQFTHEAARLSQDGIELTTGDEVATSGQSRPTLDSSTQQIDGATHDNASIAAVEILQQQRAARRNVGEEAWAALQQGSAESEAGSSLADGEFTLDLTASGDSWVEISDANGKQLELDLVRGGSTKHYTGVAPFNIQFGRASALSLYLDGQAVDLAPFTSGDVTQMILDGANNAIGPDEKDSGEG